MLRCFLFRVSIERCCCCCRRCFRRCCCCCCCRRCCRRCRRCRRRRWRVGVVVVLIDVVTKSANFEFGCCDETLARKLKSREAKFRIPIHFLSILRNAIRTDRIKTSLKFRAWRDATRRKSWSFWLPPEWSSVISKLFKKFDLDRKCINNFFSWSGLSCSASEVS